MSIIKTEAFVLKSLKYGETSKIVTLFTKDFGKMNVVVDGDIHGSVLGWWEDTGCGRNVRR